jgi:apolipoprotein N-acyltransferase
VGWAREPGEGLTNSAFLLRRGDLDPWRYDKRHLVAAVERVPLVPAPWFPDGFPGYHPGSSYPVVEVETGAGPPVAVGVTICFESAFSRAARGLVRSGADVLVNLTNDAWFGTRDGLRTHALWQHPAHLVLRAVETRTPVLRAANTGVSMVVDRRGRVVARTPLFEEARLPVELPAPPEGADPGGPGAGPTLFVRTGDLVGPVCVLAALLALLAGWRGGRSRRHTPARDG